MDNTSKDPVLNAAQRFIDHYFGNPNTERPKITIPAKESNSDLVLINGIKALRTELDEAKAKIELLREALLPLAFLDSETPQEALEWYRNDPFKDWIGFEEIEAARLALEGSSND